MVIWVWKVFSKNRLSPSDSVSPHSPLPTWCFSVKSSSTGREYKMPEERATGNLDVVRIASFQFSSWCLHSCSISFLFQNLQNQLLNLWQFCNIYSSYNSSPSYPPSGCYTGILMGVCALPLPPWNHPWNEWHFTWVFGLLCFVTKFLAFTK